MRGVVAMLLSQERAACVIISRCAAPMVKLVDTGDLKFVAPIKHIMIKCNKIKELQCLCKLLKNRFPAIFPQSLYKQRRSKKVN